MIRFIITIDRDNGRSEWRGSAPSVQEAIEQIYPDELECTDPYKFSMRIGV